LNIMNQSSPLFSSLRYYLVFGFLDHNLLVTDNALSYSLAITALRFQQI